MIQCKHEKTVAILQDRMALASIFSLLYRMQTTSAIYRKKSNQCTIICKNINAVKIINLKILVQHLATTSLRVQY
jgi:hypothetical protein